MRSTAQQSPNLKWETRLGHPSRVLAGVDEVGRGCLAGPVVAAAVILPEIVDFKAEPWLREVADSKLLSPELRETLSPKILAWARAAFIGSASVEEIDRINIYHASHLAMVRAVEGLALAPEHVLVDGNALPVPFKGKATAIIKGDLQSLSIACASVIAKVWRDTEMARLDTVYPGYGFAVHKGYATPAHRAALKEKGATDLHRRSFSPVAETLQTSLSFS